jgi:8-oxo-dGTP diphosphatase
MKDLHVVAAVIRNSRNEILMAQRPIGKAHAGLWEFPGGKIEPGESPMQALQREIREELDLKIHDAESIGTYLHRDAELTLHLHVFQARSWSGEPLGLEGQAKRWVAAARVHRLMMPSADRPVARDLGLPREYVITPEPPDPLAGSAQRRAWLQSLERTVQGTAACKLVLFRAKHQPLQKLNVIAALARDITAHHGAEILLQDNVELALSWRFGGVSLTSQALNRSSKRNLPVEMWLAASCHNAAELAHAAKIGCDFVTLAPVQSTQSHPHQEALGWEQFAGLCQQVKMPVFALGGLCTSNLPHAQSAGAWGVAGISGFWRAGA